MVFPFRKPILFFAQSDALYKKCHVSRKTTHCLKAFKVLLSLSFFQPVHAIPVLAGCDRHIADGKVLVQFIKSGRSTTSSAYNNTCSNLHAFPTVPPSDTHHRFFFLNRYLNSVFYCTITRTKYKEKAALQIALESGPNNKYEFYFPQKCLIARYVNSAVPSPPILSMFSVNSPPAAYILPRPKSTSSEHL